jgi:transcriptional regulator with XRE-family HTH domain
LPLALVVLRAETLGNGLTWQAGIFDNQIFRQVASILAAVKTTPKPKAAASTPTIPVPDELAFGRHLQQLRKQSGLSQAELAKRLGIHQSLISQYERGYLRLHGGLIVRLAVALDVTPDALLSAGNLESAGTMPPIDRRFLRRFQKIERLSPHDKKLLLGTIDAFLAAVT